MNTWIVMGCKLLGLEWGWESVWEAKCRTELQARDGGQRSHCLAFLDTKDGPHHCSSRFRHSIPLPMCTIFSLLNSSFSMALFLSSIYVSLFIWLCQVSVEACGIFCLHCSTRSLSVASCRIQFSDQGLNPGPMHWEPGVLAIGPPGKSLSTPCLPFQCTFSGPISVKGSHW